MRLQLGCGHTSRAVSRRLALILSKSGSAYCPNCKIVRPISKRLRG